jgi:Na+-translocating ferredoxin:NAD+ oxidoreductase subunit G
MSTAQAEARIGATAPPRPPLRGRLAYQAGLLGTVTLLATALLVLADRVTRGPIAERRAEDLKASLAQVIPADIHDNDLLADTLTLSLNSDEPVTIYRAVRQGQVTGVAFQLSAPGYAGAIDLILGLDPKGRVLGARVLAHRETPGLGDRIEATKDDWILAFDGRSLGDPPAERWAVRKDGGDFDQFSGATITPRAVVGALKAGLQGFAAHQDALIAPPVRNRTSNLDP